MSRLAPSSSASISRCGEYRYLLTRRWSEGPTATFVMLNPSTADASRDDPTIRKCMGFARAWDCGGLQVINLFALRATSPVDLRRSARPVGRRNEAMWDSTLAEPADIVVCAWGIHGSWMSRDRWAMNWFSERPWIQPMCLGVTTAGHPRHPLYVPYATSLQRFA